METSASSNYARFGVSVTAAVRGSSARELPTSVRLHDLPYCRLAQCYGWYKTIRSGACKCQSPAIHAWCSTIFCCFLYALYRVLCLYQLRAGATVAEWLAFSPPSKANRAQSPARPPDFRKWESCRTLPLVGGFSRGYPVSPAPAFRRSSILTSITLIGSQDLAVKSRPNLFTHSLACPCDGTFARGLNEVAVGCCIMQVCGCGFRGVLPGAREPRDGRQNAIASRHVEETSQRKPQSSAGHAKSSAGQTKFSPPSPLHIQHDSQLDRQTPGVAHTPQTWRRWPATSRKEVHQSALWQRTRSTRVANQTRGPFLESSRDQSENGHAQIKEGSTPFRLCIGAAGGAVVRLRALAETLNQGSIPSEVSLPHSRVWIIVPDVIHWSASFLRLSLFPPPLHSGATPSSSHFTLIGRPNISTPLAHEFGASSFGVIFKLSLVEAEEYPESRTLAGLQKNCDGDVGECNVSVAMQFSAAVPSGTHKKKPRERERERERDRWVLDKAACQNIQSLASSPHRIYLADTNVPWGSRLVRRRPAVREVLGSNPSRPLISLQAQPRTLISPLPIPTVQGAAVVEWLDCSPPTKANWVLRSPAGSYMDFRKWELSRVFSGTSRFPCPLLPVTFHAYFASPSLALKISMIIAVQITPVTHSNRVCRRNTCGMMLAHAVWTATHSSLLFVGAGSSVRIDLPCTSRKYSSEVAIAAVETLQDTPRTSPGELGTDDALVALSRQLAGHPHIQGRRIAGSIYHWRDGERSGVTDMREEGQSALLRPGDASSACRRTMNTRDVTSVIFWGFARCSSRLSRTTPCLWKIPLPLRLSSRRRTSAQLRIYNAAPQTEMNKDGHEEAREGDRPPERFTRLLKNILNMLGSMSVTLSHSLPGQSHCLLSDVHRLYLLVVVVARCSDETTHLALMVLRESRLLTQNHAAAYIAQLTWPRRFFAPRIA
ncbi:hypothetical protein PR048_003531 [Dryococelus australis]|uniref:Uncharacterized protein n=1 Tax=Dryococelus australis TaxID=614101 RepID=A0ABQ9INC0_9NEOP|nr:hypothetical protein PR048_003531 [Dryococelus australis]